MVQTVFYLCFGQLFVGDRERINRRLKEELFRLDLLLVLFNAEDHRVVFFYKPEQILPKLFVRVGQIDVAAPDPRASRLVMSDHRERLRVVDDYEVVAFQIVSDRVPVHYVIIDVHLQLAEIQFFALKRVVHLLGYAEEVGSALNGPPSGLDSHAAHQEGQRIQQLSHAAAVMGRVDVRNVKILERFGFLANALDGLLANQLSVIFDLNQLLMSGHSHLLQLQKLWQVFCGASNRARKAELRQV